MASIPFKLLLLLAMIPLARICVVVTGAEIAEVRAAIRRKLRGLDPRGSIIGLMTEGEDH